MITGQYGCRVGMVQELMTLLGVQDPESRKRARHLKRKDADGDSGNNLVDLEDGDGSDSAPPSKYRRL